MQVFNLMSVFARFAATTTIDAVPSSSGGFRGTPFMVGSQDVSSTASCVYCQHQPNIPGSAIGTSFSTIAVGSASTALPTTRASPTDTVHPTATAAFAGFHNITTNTTSPSNSTVLPPIIPFKDATFSDGNIILFNNTDSTPRTITFVEGYRQTPISSLNISGLSIVSQTIPDLWNGNFYSTNASWTHPNSLTGILAEVAFNSWPDHNYFDISSFLNPNDLDGVKMLMPAQGKDPAAGCTSYEKPCVNSYQWSTDDRATSATDERVLLCFIGNGLTEFPGIDEKGTPYPSVSQPWIPIPGSSTTASTITVRVTSTLTVSPGDDGTPNPWSTGPTFSATSTSIPATSTFPIPVGSSPVPVASTFSVPDPDSSAPTISAIPFAGTSGPLASATTSRAHVSVIPIPVVSSSAIDVSTSESTSPIISATYSSEELPPWPSTMASTTSATLIQNSIVTIVPVTIPTITPATFQTRESGISNLPPFPVSSALSTKESGMPSPAPTTENVTVITTTIVTVVTVTETLTMTLASTLSSSSTLEPACTMDSPRVSGRRLRRMERTRLRRRYDHRHRHQGGAASLSEKE